MIAKKFKMTKTVDAEEIYRKFAALGKIYEEFSCEKDTLLSDDVIIGMTQLYCEALIDLELFLFEERYTKMYDHLTKDVEMVQEEE